MCLCLLLLLSLFRVGDILRGSLRDLHHHFVKEMPCYLPFKGNHGWSTLASIARTYVDACGER